MYRSLRVFLLIGAATAGAIACTKAEDPEQCTSQSVCSSNVGVCCSATQCHYTFNGQRFDCNGTNCDAAAQRVVNAACASTGDLSLASEGVSRLATASRLMAAESCQAPSLP